LFEVQAIAADAARDLYVLDELPRISKFAAGATGNATPEVTISGSKTLLSPNTPRGIAADSAGNIYVANVRQGFSNGVATESGALLMFAAGSDGNVAPAAVISGLHTGFSADVVPLDITLDKSGNIYALASNSLNDGSNASVFVFDHGSNGDVSPRNQIAGALTGLATPRSIALDAGGNIYVENFPGPGTVYRAGASGDSLPLTTINDLHESEQEGRAFAIFGRYPLTAAPILQNR
jgi:hypothetical protein